MKKKIDWEGKANRWVCRHGLDDGIYYMKLVFKIKRGIRHVHMFNKLYRIYRAENKGGCPPDKRVAGGFSCDDYNKKGKKACDKCWSQFRKDLEQ